MSFSPDVIIACFKYKSLISIPVLDADPLYRCIYLHTCQSTELWGSAVGGRTRPALSLSIMSYILYSLWCSI